MNVAQTLIIDLAPLSGSSVTACVSIPDYLHQTTSLINSYLPEQSCEVLLWGRTCFDHRHHSRFAWNRVDIRSLRRYLCGVIALYVLFSLLGA